MAKIKAKNKNKSKAKNKGKGQNKGQRKTPLSPARYMREKARTLPIGKCYVAPPDWQEAGLAHVIVTRVRPSGNLVMAIFLVDTFCLGVKDAFYSDNVTPYEFEEQLNTYENRLGLKEASYNEAHNIIYGAIAFAEEGGIMPAKDFNSACYVLEEDTDDIPLIEYDFGKDGKHLLVVGPDRKEMRYIKLLRKKLGEDFELESSEEEERDDALSQILSKVDDSVVERALKNMNNMFDEMARHPREVYSYQYPDYPQTLSVKHQFIADEFLSHDNDMDLPREVIDRILALPKDEAVHDISNVVLYVIGQTYKGINDGTIAHSNESALMHALILLARLQSDKGLDAVLEIMRQNGRFADHHFGDFAPELIQSALYACGQNNVSAIEAYINEPDLDSYLRSRASDALAMIVIMHPERRDEIIAVYRRLLVRMVSDLPELKACDGAFAGSLMSDLIDIEATELIPEIKAVFATDCVDKSVAGDCKTVIEDIENRQGVIDKNKYRVPDIYEMYECLRSFKNRG